MRELTTSLCHDVDYQYRLRADFRRRRVHPAVETLVWSHVIGKPTERVQLSADVTMNQKLDQERELSVNGDASLSDYFRQKRRFQRLDFVSVGFFVFVVNAIVTSTCTRTALPSFWPGAKRHCFRASSDARSSSSSSDWTISRRVGYPVPINHASEEQRSIDAASHRARRVMGFDVANESRRGHPISRLVDRVVLLRHDGTNEQAERERNATHCCPHVPFDFIPWLVTGTTRHCRAASAPSPVRPQPLAGDTPFPDDRIHPFKPSVASAVIAWNAGWLVKDQCE